MYNKNFYFDENSPNWQKFNGGVVPDGYECMSFTHYGLMIRKKIKPFNEFNDALIQQAADNIVEKENSFNTTMIIKKLMIAVGRDITLKIIKDVNNNSSKNEGLNSAL